MFMFWIDLELTALVETVLAVSSMLTWFAMIWIGRITT